ncbi:hypothetical protein [Nocardia carnea]|uniref:hypothetical protein n=1 Tax=Nocardia carnea TaxID=37328 RepID=UPI002457CD7C|nr:hypothetical protein [Nocardia carnea]
MSPVPQPPFSAELLADLHAGNIDPELEARLWPAVRQDPDARRYLESLDALRASLTGLAESDRVVRPMPAEIAARLDAFAESLGSAAGRTGGADTAGSVEATVPLGDIRAPAFSGRSGAADADRSAPVAGPIGGAPISLDSYRRRRRIAATIAAAAAVLICAGAALLVGTRPDGETTPTAAPTGTAGTEPGADIDTAVALRALGRHDVPGRLADPAALAACVRAAGVDRPVLGSTEMRFRDRTDAVLILVGGRNGAQITALVVGPGCGPGNPELLTSITDIG